jgi:S1-C subfamily serine protease
MWINVAKGGMQVMDVTADGPAAQAGIEAGDVITEVDGKPASSIPVYELRRMLRDDSPGTLVRFTIRRGTQMHKLDVKLRDQI